MCIIYETIIIKERVINLRGARVHRKSWKGKEKWIQCKFSSHAWNSQKQLQNLNEKGSYDYIGSENLPALWPTVGRKKNM